MPEDKLDNYRTHQAAWLTANPRQQTDRWRAHSELIPLANSIADLTDAQSYASGRIVAWIDAGGEEDGSGTEWSEAAVRRHVGQITAALRSLSSILDAVDAPPLNEEDRTHVEGARRKVLLEHGLTYPLRQYMDYYSLQVDERRSGVRLLRVKPSEPWPYGARLLVRAIDEYVSFAAHRHSNAHDLVVAARRQYAPQLPVQAWNQQRVDFASVL